MNREILFRGKCLRTGQWRYGYLYNESVINMVGNVRIKVIPSTVGQFTGLTDKNGIKIFEGDLLHRQMNIHWVVTFKQSTWIADSPTGNFGLYLSASQFKETTITGNIHDNPTP